MERYCAQISLTSISFLSSGDPRLHKVAFEKVEKDLENHGSIFAETAVYAKMMLLHKHFTERLTEKPTQPRLNNSDSNPEIITAVQLFSSKEENPIVILPFAGWIVQAMISWSKNSSEMILDRVYTHPLEKKEIDRTLNGQNCDPEKTTVEIYLHETLLTPKSQFTFGLDTFPSTLIIPATGGIAMSIQCQRPEEETLNFAYTCVPRKFSVGQLTCAAMTNNSMLEIQTPSRVERSIGEAEEKEVKDQKPDFWVKIRY